MPLRAGSLNHRVTIQSLESVQDETTGNITEEWTEFAEVWANIRPATVREFIDAGAEQTSFVVSVQIRYVPGILPSMRILHEDHVYNIEGVLPDPHSGREWLTLPCSEVIEG